MSDESQFSLEVDDAVDQLIAMITSHRAEQSRPDTLLPGSAAAVPLEWASDFSRPYVYETRYCKSLHFNSVEVQSRMLKREPDRLALDYTRTMMGFLLFNPRPQRIAMIGLGGGSLAKFCFRHLPQTRMDVVEINPHVLALRDEFQVPPDDHRFRVHLADGAHFIAHASNPYDVLLVDGYTQDGVPATLSSQEFFRRCREVLSVDGILVVNLICVDSGAHIDRIQQCFPGTVVTVDETTCSNRIVFAFVSDLVRTGRIINNELTRMLCPTVVSLLRRNFANVIAATQSV